MADTHIPRCVAAEPVLWWAVGIEAGGEITGVRERWPTEAEALECPGWPGARIWAVTRHSRRPAWSWDPRGLWRRA